MYSKVFTPNPDSSNRLERIAFYAIEAGRNDIVEECVEEFEREGSEDDCLHEYEG
jgi:hypothetical protein